MAQVRHAAAPMRAVTVVSWLVVTVLGLSIGALGAGGLLDLVQGKGEQPVSFATSGIAGSQDGGAGLLPGKAAGQAGRLGADGSVAPLAVPDGVALPGRAPAAVVARDGNYVAFTPTSIRLPSGRLAAILPAGVHSDGALNVPQNPDQLGWWTGGAEPGEPYGTVVLAGHVDSARFGLGVLAEVKTMHKGDVIKVADGVHGQRYRVQQITEIPKVTLAAGTSLFDQDVKHRLVLITCGGPFDQRTHRYQDNVVVVATPIT